MLRGGDDDAHRYILPFCQALVLDGLSVGADAQVERGTLRLRHVLIPLLVAGVMRQGHTCDIWSQHACVHNAAESRRNPRVRRADFSRDLCMARYHQRKARVSLQAPALPWVSQGVDEVACPLVASGTILLNSRCEVGATRGAVGEC